MEKINIWLDDIRPAPEGFIWVKTVKDVMRTIVIANSIAGKNVINILSLDNDLGENQKEGYKVLDYLEVWKFKYSDFNLPKEIRVHSANPVAKRRMETVINKLYSKETYNKEY